MKLGNTSKSPRGKSNLTEFILIAAIILASSVSINKLAHAGGFSFIWEYQPTANVLFFNPTNSTYTNATVSPNSIVYIRDVDQDHVAEIVMGSKMPETASGFTTLEPKAQLSIISGATGVEHCSTIHPYALRIRNISAHKDEDGDGKGDILAIVDSQNYSTVSIYSSANCQVIHSMFTQTGINVDGDVKTMLKNADLNSDHSKDIVVLDRFVVKALSN